ncbi:MAG: arsenate reductase (glutaredoxin) [Halopseudomonas yangmingensis]|uniref:Arsenate reductase n=1 Tax=Halopseudomonas yangmingensis TaxID=1720063 RepID=A0A1I4NGB1_9GAMM|nr:arsenate reductase (glutaredoxin) [Halopseudomonas yangmingensis]SFM14416.1 arsenate reductase [Halopseudomonas yangmingensis]
MSSTLIYHNPRCSKSRQALELLTGRGIDPEVIRYLDTPPDAATLSELLKLLGINARQLMRSGEEVYRELQLDNPGLSEADLVQAMVDYPRLIERPIVVHNGQAVLARPPEKLLELFP